MTLEPEIVATLDRLRGQHPSWTFQSHEFCGLTIGICASSGDSHHGVGVRHPKAELDHEGNEFITYGSLRDLAAIEALLSDWISSQKN